MSLTIEKDMGGLIFANNTDNPSAPDYKGEIKIDGKQYEIALWGKVFDKGGDGFTVKIQEPYEASEQTSKPPANKKMTARAKPTRR